MARRGPHRRCVSPSALPSFASLPFCSLGARPVARVSLWPLRSAFPSPLPRSAHFIPPGSALDEEAKRRATSVYLIQRVRWGFPAPVSAQLPPPRDVVPLTHLFSPRFPGYFRPACAHCPRSIPGPAHAPAAPVRAALLAKRGRRQAGLLGNLDAGWRGEGAPPPGQGCATEVEESRKGSVLYDSFPSTAFYFIPAGSGNPSRPLHLLLLISFLRGKILLTCFLVSP